MTRIYSNSEILLTAIIVPALVFIIVSIGAWSYISSVDRYNLFSQAYKTDQPDLFQYAVDTEVGNILTQGEIRVTQTHTMHNVQGEFASITKVHQEERKKTRQVSYQCGTEDAPKTCYRTETYWEWDTISSDTNEHNEYSIHDVVVPVCPGSKSRLNPQQHYTGPERKDFRHVYPEKRKRFYFEVRPATQNATIFLRSIEGGISNPRHSGCIERFVDKSIDDVLKMHEPNINIAIWGSFIFVILGICGVVGLFIAVDL